jgi:WD40 repeat protein
MVVPTSKKKSPILFFLTAFVTIVVVMLLANRESVLVEKVHFPLNRGVAGLSTWKDFLVAVCLDNKIYVWDWENLSEEPRTGLAQSHKAFLMDSDRVVSLRQRNPKAVVAANLAGDRKYREIPIGSNSGNEYLGVNRDRTTVALLLVEEGSYDISIVDADAGRVDPVAKISEEVAKCQVTDLAVSDDGALVVLFGEKDGGGWLLLVNLRQRRAVWEKRVPELRLFFGAAFSEDGKVIYARGSDSTLHKIETASGKILDRSLPGGENKSTLKTQHVQSVAVSTDGKFVAASVSGTAYVWDCETGKKVFSQAPGHKLTSGMAFSPDSRFLATSDLRQGGTIKIWRMPKP